MIVLPMNLIITSVNSSKQSPLYCFELYINLYSAFWWTPNRGTSSAIELGKTEWSWAYEKLHLALQLISTSPVCQTYVGLLYYVTGIVHNE